MENPQTLTLMPIDKAAAARAFAPCAGLDPDGIETPEGAASAGQCYRLETDTGTLVFSVSVVAGGLWCHAAAGIGRGMAAAGLRTMEHQARQSGCHSVAFQTMRRGLIRLANRHGYAIRQRIGVGVILFKEIK